MKRIQWKLFFILILVTTGLLLLFLSIDFRLYKQTFANTIPGPFLMGNQVGENIDFSLPNISRVDIRVATYNRVNDSLITCYVLQEDRILASRTINTRHLQDNEIYSIFFRPAVSLEPDKGFTVLFETNADLESKNYISLYLSDRAKSRYSHFFLNEHAHYDKNLWLRLYSRLTWGQIIMKFMNNQPSPWTIIIPGIIIYMLVFILWKSGAAFSITDEK